MTIQFSTKPQLEALQSILQHAESTDPEYKFVEPINTMLNRFANNETGIETPAWKLARQARAAINKQELIAFKEYIGYLDPTTVYAELFLPPRMQGQYDQGPIIISHYEVAINRLLKLFPHDPDWPVLPSQSIEDRGLPVNVARLAIHRFAEYLFKYPSVKEKEIESRIWDNEGRAWMVCGAQAAIAPYLERRVIG